MTTIYNRQKSAKAELIKIWEHPENALVIHYSCESFFDRPDGSSPRVTSIAVRNLKSAQTQSFSIHQFGELAGKKPDELEPEYNQFEKQMLEAFFDFVSRNQNAVWVHWNMRDGNYGFQALEHRLKVLGGSAVAIVHDDRKYDLSRILIGIYGKAYIEHGESGRLHNLMVLNNVSSRSFQTGKVEADLFNSRQYVALHQSALAKTDVMANICQLAFEGSLITRATFLQLHAPTLRAGLDWLNEHPIVKVGGIIATIIGGLGWLYPALSYVWGLI